MNPASPMKVVVATAIALAGAAAPARAQPGTYAPPAAPIAGQVDENVALGLSLGGTVLSWGLMIGAAYSENRDTAGLATVGALGTFFAPSFGHWYAHSALTRGMGIRALGLGVGMVGIGMALDSAFDESSNGNDDAASTVLLLAAALYVVGTVDDIATSASMARKYNSRFRDVSLVLAPTPQGGGVALAGRF